MAKNKQYEPSAKKRRDAKAKGEIAKSSLLVQAVSLLSLGLFYSVIMQLFHTLSLLFDNSLLPGEDFHTKDLLLSGLQYALVVGLWACVVLISCGLTTLLAEIFQTGLSFQASRLWQPKRINPMKGLSEYLKLSSANSWPVSFVRLSLLLGFWLLMMATLFVGFLRDLVRTNVESLTLITSYTALALWELTFAVAVIAVVVGILDLWLARRLLFNRLRMDREELKREHKETQGDPMIAGKRKQLHSELLAHDQIANVRRAKVLVID